MPDALDKIAGIKLNGCIHFLITGSLIFTPTPSELFSSTRSEALGAKVQLLRLHIRLRNPLTTETGQYPSFKTRRTRPFLLPEAASNTKSLHRLSVPERSPSRGLSLRKLISLEVAVASKAMQAVRPRCGIFV